MAGEFVAPGSVTDHAQLSEDFLWYPLTFPRGKVEKFKVCRYNFQGTRTWRSAHGQQAGWGG
jgi:hypothetical protein